MKKILIALMGVVFTLSVQTVVAQTQQQRTVVPLQGAYALLPGDDIEVSLRPDDVYKYEIRSCEFGTNTVEVFVTNDSTVAGVEQQPFEVVVDASSDGSGGNTYTAGLVPILNPGDTTSILFDGVAGGGTLGVRVDGGVWFEPNLCEAPPPTIVTSYDNGYTYSIPQCGPYNSTDAVKVLVEDLYGPTVNQVVAPGGFEFLELWKDLEFYPTGEYKSGTFIADAESFALPFAGNAVYEFPGVVGGGSLSIRAIATSGDFLNLCEAPAPTINNDIDYNFTATFNLANPQVLEITVNAIEYLGIQSNEVRGSSAAWVLRVFTKDWLDTPGNVIDLNFGDGSDYITNGSLLLDISEVRGIVQTGSNSFSIGDHFILEQSIVINNGGTYTEIIDLGVME